MPATTGDASNNGRCQQQRAMPATTGDASNNGRCQETRAMPANTNDATPGPRSAHGRRRAHSPSRAFELTQRPGAPDVLLHRGGGAVSIVLQQLFVNRDVAEMRSLNVVFVGCRVVPAARASVGMDRADDRPTKPVAGAPHDEAVVTEVAVRVVFRTSDSSPSTRP